MTAREQALEARVHELEAALNAAVEFLAIYAEQTRTSWGPVFFIEKYLTHPRLSEPTATATYGGGA